MREWRRGPLFFGCLPFVKEVEDAERSASAECHAGNDAYDDEGLKLAVLGFKRCLVIGRCLLKCRLKIVEVLLCFLDSLVAVCNRLVECGLRICKFLREIGCISTLRVISASAAL